MIEITGWLIPDTKMKDWKSWVSYVQLTAARKCVKHEKSCCWSKEPVQINDDD